MGITLTPTNSDKEYAEIRGNLAESPCQLTWQAMKLYRLDDNTVAIAGWLQTALGLDIYPRDKQAKYPELAFIKLHNCSYEVNGKDASGNWIKVKREPSLVEKDFVNEVLSNWNEWGDKVWTGSIMLNDAMANPAITPVGAINLFWKFETNLYGKVVEWMLPEKRENGNGYTKFTPKKTALEVYDETRMILEKELTTERSLGVLLRELKEKFGETESGEIVNTVVYGILSK